VVGLTPGGLETRFTGAAGVLDALIDGVDLSRAEAAALMDLIFDGEVAPAVVAGVLVALRAKGETSDELGGMVESMVAHATPLTLSVPVMDVVGTGGDGHHSVNVSTMAAITIAGAGVAVCKHGNRAASSQVGTADVLEHLGVKIELDSEGVARCVEEAGIGFCFAQAFHPAMRFVGPIRRELGVRTAFNLLGPLANPARPGRLLVGTADPTTVEKMAAVLGSSGVERAWVVAADDGLDEISTTGPTRVVEVLGDGTGAFELGTFQIEPATLGLAPASLDDVRGADADHNGSVVLGVLAGDLGPVRDIVLLNAAAALVVAERAKDLEEGLELAATSIDSGAARASLDKLVAASNR